MDIHPNDPDQYFDENQMGVLRKIESYFKMLSNFYLLQKINQQAILAGIEGSGCMADR
jgi:hypothetical protein